MTTSAQDLARTRLAAVYPSLGPWTTAALWHGRAQLVAPPTSPLADELVTIGEQRLSGLLLRYLQASGAEIAPEHYDVLRRTAFAGSMTAVEVLRLGVPVIAALARRGYELPVSKGPGIAQFYPGANCRPYFDLDLVVEPDRFPQLINELEADGWREDERNVQPWNYFQRRCREAVNLHRKDGASLDVHHRFPPWLWSQHINMAGVARRAENVEVGGETIRCLAPVDNLLVVVLHVISDRNAPGHSLLVWRDLVELANAVPLGEAVTAAAQARLAGWLKALLSALPEDFGTAELREALPDQPIAHPRRLAALLSPRAERLGVIASQTLRLPKANGLAFMGGMLLPSPAFLARKFPDESHLYRQWYLRKRRASL